MPSNIIKSFADKTGKSTDEVEKLWKKSKDIVKNEYKDVEPESDKYYALVTGILKRMLRINEYKTSNFNNLYKSLIIEGDGSNPMKIPKNYKKLKGIKRDLFIFDIYDRLAYLYNRIEREEKAKAKLKKIPKNILKIGNESIKEMEDEIAELNKIKDEIKNG